MFQKGTGSWRKTLVLAFVVCGSGLGAYAESPMFNREAFLAEVEIDDLLMRKDRKAPTADNENEKKQQAVASTESINKTNLEEAKQYQIDEKMVLAEIKHQIAGHFEIKDNFRIFFDRPWAEVVLKNPDWELIISSFPAQGLRSRFFVSFELWSQGKRIVSRQKGVHCELWTDAYVALQQIDRGTVMHDGLVAIQLVDTLSIYQSPVEIGTSLIDYMVINRVKQGQPIYRKDLKERPLIEKNNIIDVVAQEGLMKVTMKGKALEDGVKGQFIRIRNLQSFSDIQAEVIGVNRARVFF